MKKLFAAIFFFLFLLPGVVYSTDNVKKQLKAEKAHQRYMKRMERRITRQHARFLKKQYKAEIKAGKKTNGIGTHYQNLVKPK